MLSCPCCGEILPADAETGQLCSVCSSAIDGKEPPPQIQYPAVPIVNVPIVRPLGVTALALFNFASAILALGWITIAIPLLKSDRATGIVLIVVLILAACLGLVFGRAFWNLREWVRITAIILAGWSLVAGKPSEEWWSRALDLATMFYLVSPGVRAVFLEASRQPKPIILARSLTRRRSADLPS